MGAGDLLGGGRHKHFLGHSRTCVLQAQIPVNTLNVTRAAEE